MRIKTNLFKILEHITLFPNLKNHMIDYVNNQNMLNIIEEHLLAPQ